MYETLPAASPHSQRGSNRLRRGDLAPADLICSLAPLVILLPVLGAIAVTAVRLFGTAHPAIGWGSTVNSDAEAIFLGHWPYVDPATGYAAEGYTPLYPLVIAGLHEIRLWAGWPIVATIASTLVLVGIAARLAYRPGPVRWLRVAEAVGIGTIAWSVVNTLDSPLVYDGRADQFAWALAFSSVLFLPRALAGSRRALVAMLALISLAYWAKQPAVMVAAGLGVAALASAWPDRRRLARVVGVGALTLALNALVVAALAIATDGWQLKINYGFHLPIERSLSVGLSEFFSRAAVGLVFLGVLLALLWAWRRRGRVESAPSAPVRSTSVGVALAVATLLGAASGIWLRRYWGGADTDYIGAYWGIGMLIAWTYGRLRERPNAAPALAGATLLLAATTLTGASWSLRHGTLFPSGRFQALPGWLVGYERTHLVYDPILADFNVADHHLVLPNEQHLLEALDHGRQPRWFARMLLERRFDAITGLFGADALDADLALAPRAEDGYFWKLNEVIQRKYTPSRTLPGLPAGFGFLSDVPGETFVRRPGPDPAPWLRTCFGPFHVAGATFDIGRGGGLWCSRPGSGMVQLRGTPAPSTQLRSRGEVEPLSGSVGIALARAPGAAATIAVGPAWSIGARVANDLSGVVVERRAGGRRTTEFVTRARLHRTRGRLALAVGGAPRGQLVLTATRQAAPTFDFRALDLRPARG